MVSLLYNFLTKYYLHLVVQALLKTKTEKVDCFDTGRQILSIFPVTESNRSVFLLVGNVSVHKQVTVGFTDESSTFWSEYFM